MSDVPGAHLVGAAARLLGETAVALADGEVQARTDVSDVAGAAAAVRAASAQLLVALRGDVDGAERTHLTSLLQRADHLDGRFGAAARDAAARRRDAFERALREFRTCTTMAELLERLAPVMCTGCGADRIVAGIVDDGAWTPLREATSANPDGPTEAAEAPVPLADLPSERAAFTSGRSIAVAATPGRGDGPARPASVIAPTFVGGRARGLFRAEFGGVAPTDEDVEVVERMGRALGHAFEMLEMHERLISLERTVERLRATVGERSPDDLDGAAALAVGRPLASSQGRPGNGPVTRGRPSADLTPRQRQTLELMLLGLSNAQIAERLVVGVPTVKSHVGAILRAIGAVNRAEAIGRYLEREGRDQAT